LACAALGAAFAWQAAAVSAQPAAAQKPKAAAPTRPAGESDADALMRARVLDVLRQTAGESKDWPAASAASSVQARAADLMWEADPAAGRDTLLLAWETAGKVTEPKRERNSYRNYSKRTAARRDVLMVARRRDQPLAEKWVEEMAREKESESDGAGRGLFDDRSERSAVLLQMAMGVVKDDPRAAADMATESLRDGISFGLQSVLVALQEQSFELAERVFRAALARLSSAGMSDPNELMILASYLYTLGRIGAANADSDPGRRNIAVSRTAATITPAERETSPLARDLALARAAAATDPEAYERGRQVAGKIKGKELRADVTNWLTYRATLALLKRGELARARALAARNEDLAPRAVPRRRRAETFRGEGQRGRGRVAARGRGADEEGAGRRALDENRAGRRRRLR
jgi:DNA-binding transcriptional MerR regulator